MSIFYFDKIIGENERNFLWDKTLIYLEGKYRKEPSVHILNSLIGFSWYYFVEGPIESGKYGNDENKLALGIWKKYVDIGTKDACNDQYFNFIAGYTLSLQGFLLDDEYANKGMVLLQRCCSISTNILLKMLVENYVSNANSKKYVPLTKEQRIQICENLFEGDSLLEKYFREIYS